MASGHLCLVITEDVTWEGFPEWANRVLFQIEGVLKGKADGVDTRVWEIECQGCGLLLVFQDYPVQASLESDSKWGDEILKQILHKLESLPSDSPRSTPRG